MISEYGKSNRWISILVYLLLVLGSFSVVRWGSQQRIIKVLDDVELRFVFPDGSIQLVSTKWNTPLVYPLIETPSNMVFVGWYLDEAGTMRLAQATTPRSNRTFYPKFDTRFQEVRFVDSFGVLYARVIGPVGAEWTAPDPPQYTWYDFVGYSEALPPLIPENLLVIEAKYERKPKRLTIQRSDGLADVVEFITDIINTSQIPLPEPIPGYEFVGYRISTWDEEQIVLVGDDVDIPTHSVVAFLYKPSEFTISFGYVGGLFEPLVRLYQSVIGDLPMPTREDAEFIGWYVDQALTQVMEFITMPSKDLLLYAKWSSTVPSSRPPQWFSPTPVTSPAEDSPAGEDEDPIEVFPTTFEYRFTDRGNPVSFGLLEEADIIPIPTDPTPTSGLRFEGWRYASGLASSGTILPMPTMNLSFEAEYTTIYYLTVIFNNAGQEEAVVYEYEEGEEFLLQNDIDFVESEDFEPISVLSNDSEPVFRTLSFTTLSESADVAVEAWYEDPKLQDSGLLVVTQSGVMPNRNLVLHARWNFKVEVQLQDPVEPDVILGSGLFYPGELLDEESLARMTFNNTLGYDDIDWPTNGFRAPAVLPSSGAQPFNPSYRPLPFEFQIVIASGVNQSIENVYRGSEVLLPMPNRNGFVFDGFYEDEELNHPIPLDQGKFAFNATQVANRGNAERKIKFYVRWIPLPAEAFIIRYFDEYQVEISSGSFESGSEITLTPPSVPMITNFIGQWSIPGNDNTFDVPSIMPFGNVDVIPYYAMSLDYASGLIKTAENNLLFSGLVIQSGMTDLSTLLEVLNSITSGLNERDANLTITILREAAFSTSGLNEYNVTISNLVQTPSITMIVIASYEYTNEYLLVTVEEELLEVFDSNESSFTETNSSSVPAATYRFKSNDSVCVGKNLRHIRTTIAFTFTQGVVITISDPTVIGAIGSDRYADFEVEILINLNVGEDSVLRVITRRVWFRTGGETFPGIC